MSGLIAVDRAGTVPIQRQIYDRIRQAIAEGRLKPGDRLPSVRSLASQLALARGTVDAAYAMLTGEGYLLARGPAGTVVSPALRRPPPERPAVRPPEPGLRPDDAAERPVPPFRLGLPALDAFPRALWARLAGRQARALSVAGLNYPDPTGLPALRQAVTSYLAVARGVDCSPDQVMITGGYQSALALILQVLMRPGDAAWVEDPGYQLARAALAAAGARLVPVPVDGDGLRVADGIARCDDARFAVVTPAHQSPLGVALALPRRLALLAWAADSGAWIVEDDYDSEFRYVGRPLPALKSLDRDGRVLYVGSFSKVLFPALRLGYLVVPESQAEAFARVCRLLQGGRAAFDQAVVAAFLAEGHFARHLRRMRSLYAARRKALAAALAAAFGDRVEVALAAGGMHLMARFPGLGPDTALADRARAAGLAPTALSPLAAEQDVGQALLLGFTNIAEANAADVAERLRAAIAPSGPVVSAGHLR